MGSGVTEYHISWKDLESGKRSVSNRNMRSIEIPGWIMHNPILCHPWFTKGRHVNYEVLSSSNLIPLSNLTAHDFPPIPAPWFEAKRLGKQRVALLVVPWNARSAKLPNYVRKLMANGSALAGSGLLVVGLLLAILYPMYTLHHAASSSCSCIRFPVHIEVTWESGAVLYRAMVCRGSIYGLATSFTPHVRNRSVLTRMHCLPWWKSNDQWLVGQIIWSLDCIW